MGKLLSINKDQRLYVMPCGGGFSCLGFDVLYNSLHRYPKVLGVPVKSKNKGSRRMFTEYHKILEVMRKSGKRYDCDLFKPFVGHEGERVEVVYSWGETERFYIGKTTGFIPVHIGLKRRNSWGGDPVMADSIKSYRFV